MFELPSVGGRDGMWFLALSSNGEHLLSIFKSRLVAGVGIARGYLYQDILFDMHDLNLPVNHPNSGIRVYAMDLNLVLPGDHIWRRVTNLGTHSLFLGLNYPMNVNILGGTLTPLLRQNYVYTSYEALSEQTKCLKIYVIRDHDSNVEEYDDEEWIYDQQSPVWFKPSVDNIHTLIDPHSSFY
jgi:hypothetical protein